MCPQGAIKALLLRLDMCPQGAIKALLLRLDMCPHSSRFLATTSRAYADVCCRMLTYADCSSLTTQVFGSNLARYGVYAIGNASVTLQAEP
jgi:hypothetical protein